MEMVIVGVKLVSKHYLLTPWPTFSHPGSHYLAQFLLRSHCKAASWEYGLCRTAYLLLWSLCCKYIQGRDLTTIFFFYCSALSNRKQNCFGITRLIMMIKTRRHINMRGMSCRRPGEEGCRQSWLMAWHPVEAAPDTVSANTKDRLFRAPNLCALQMPS